MFNIVVTCGGVEVGNWWQSHFDEPSSHYTLGGVRYAPVSHDWQDDGADQRVVIEVQKLGFSTGGHQPA